MLMMVGNLNWLDGLDVLEVNFTLIILTGRVIAAIYGNDDRSKSLDGNVGVVAELAKTFDIKDPITGATKLCIPLIGTIIL